MRACDYMSRGPIAHAILDHTPVMYLHAAVYCDQPSSSIMGTFACKCIVYTFGVGRSPLADVVLDYPSISPLHAALHYDDNNAGYWRVTDLGSAPGTAFHAWPASGECAEIEVQAPVKWLCRQS